MIVSSSRHDQKKNSGMNEILLNSTNLSTKNKHHDPVFCFFSSPVYPKTTWVYMAFKVPKTAPGAAVATLSPPWVIVTSYSYF